LPRKKKKEIEPPKPDVAEKLDPEYSPADFDKALEKVITQRPDDSSGRDRE
jgi:hypothetical protein